MIKEAVECDPRITYKFGKLSPNELFPLCTLNSSEGELAIVNPFLCLQQEVTQRASRSFKYNSGDKDVLPRGRTQELLVPQSLKVFPSDRAKEKGVRSRLELRSLLGQLQ